ncbi:MAG: hypothetical protein ACRETC_11400 [Gammaproteobacteria bacterium]
MNKLPMMIAMLAGCSMLAGVLPQAWSDPGDIIITRQVSPRTAFRSGTGPVSAKTNPGQQVQNILGLNRYSGGTVAHELTNSEFSNVATGVPMQTGTLAARSAGIAGAQSNAVAGGGGYGLAAGSMMTGSMGGGAGGTAGGMAQQATGQVMDALKGIGFIGR